MKKKSTKRKASIVAMGLGMAAGPALAAGQSLIPVIDMVNFATNSANAATNAANLIVNTENAAANTANAAANSASLVANLAQVAELAIISKQLKDPDKDSVTYNINKNIEINTEINNDFTWIINKDGEEIIPIPFQEKLDKIMNGQDVAQYTSHYKSLEEHEKNPLGHFGDRTATEAARARKAANDALVEAITHDEGALAKEAEVLTGLGRLTKDTQGHGHQLQIANALAGTQANQLMRLRSMMLVSEAARAAEAQAAADRDARALAVGKRMRSGLDNAINQSIKPAPAY